MINEVPAVDLSIIIVNWNSREYVQKCIAAVDASTSGLSYEVIVVDSGSFDGCETMLQQAHPKARFIQSAVNIGFGRASTLGAGHARGGVLLFLNPDTEVRPGAIERMYRHLAAVPRAGVVGGRLLNGDGSLQRSCVQSLPTILNQLLDADILRRWFPRARLFGNRALFAASGVASEVEVVSGACMMMRRERFVLVGGFSAEYFMYGEDLDLCFKMRCKGYRNYHVSDAVVVHHGGGSTQYTVSRFSIVMTVDSVNRFLRKSRGTVYSTGYRVGMVGAAVVRLALLCFFLPVGWLLGAHRRGLAVFRKWLFVLRWGLGLERWIADYGGVSSVAGAMQGVETSCAGSAEN